MVEITHAVARKVLNTVDAGLVLGVGKPILGQMCIEAAVCFALGEPHGDEPSCVAPAVRERVSAYRARLPKAWRFSRRFASRPTLRARGSGFLFEADSMFKAMQMEPPSV